MKSSLQSSTFLQAPYAVVDPHSPLISTTEPTFIPLRPNTTTTRQPVTDPVSGFSFERGPRYNLYSQLRESRLRSKRMMMRNGQGPQSLIPTSEPWPIRASNSKSSNGYSVLFQSVPSGVSSFSRKENRRPADNVNPSRFVVVEKGFTPRQALAKARALESGSKVGGTEGSNSVISDVGEKRILPGRKSNVSFEEVRGISKATASAITGEIRLGGGGEGKSLSVSTVGEKRGLVGRKSYACFEELKELSRAAASAIAGESTVGGYGGGGGRGGRIGKMIEESKAANATSQRRVGLGAAAGRTRKSFASFEEIRRFTAVSGINGGSSVNKGGKAGRKMLF